MDKIKKLLSKISKKDRDNLSNALGEALRNSKNLRIVKIKNTDFFKYRCGRFRIIFYKRGGKNIIIDIKNRDENTYKNL